MNNSPSASTGVSKIVKAGLEDQWKSYSGNCQCYGGGLFELSMKTEKRQRELADEKKTHKDEEKEEA